MKNFLCQFIDICKMLIIKALVVNEYKMAFNYKIRIKIYYSLIWQNEKLFVV